MVSACRAASAAWTAVTAMAGADWLCRKSSRSDRYLCRIATSVACALTGRRGCDSGSVESMSPLVPRMVPPTAAATPNMPTPTTPAAPAGSPMAHAVPAPAPATSRFQGSRIARTACVAHLPAIRVGLNRSGRMAYTGLRSWTGRWARSCRSSPDRWRRRRPPGRPRRSVAAPADQRRPRSRW